MPISTDVLNTTFRNLKDPKVNTFARKTPFMKAVYNANGMREKAGGTYIERPLMTGAVSSFTGIVSGFELLSATRTQRTEQIKVEPHRIAGLIVIPNRELRQNSGKEAVIDLIEKYPMADLDSFNLCLESYFLTGAAPANGNQGETLLTSRNMDLVITYLEAMQSVGMTGAGVQISYPLLVADYPRSAEYLAFYKQVATEVHARNMKLLIETSPVFAGTQFSAVKADYSGMTAQDYFAERQAMALLIATEIKPDYISISHEPDTEGLLTGLPLTNEDIIAFVVDTAARIHQVSATLVGAGNGSWESLEFIKIYVQKPEIDFINLHIYPILSQRTNFLDTALEAAKLANAHGKKLVIGESWLYKVAPNELQAVGIGDFYYRDAYSFWEPLDIKFMQAIMSLAYSQKFDFVSFFWSKYFFGYLDYNDAHQLPEQMLMRQSNRASYANLVDGTLSETGKAYQQMLAR